MAFRDLTRGSIPRLILVLALPVFGSFVLQSLYSLVDLYFVGLLGGAPVAGLGIALNTFFLVLAIGQTIGIGTLAVLSRAHGAKDTDHIQRYYGQSMMLVILTGGLIWFAGYLAADWYFSIQTEDPEVFREGTAFFRIYIATTLIQSFLMVNGYARRAMGDFLTPTLLMGASVLINLAFDPLLIFGWGPVPAMGIRGAAWATVGSQLVSAGVYCWLMLGSSRNPYLVLRGFPWPHWPTLWHILRIGVPSGTQFILFSMINVVMFGYVKPFGAEATAAFAIGFRIIHSSILPAVAICAAVSSLVGQNFGARDWPRMRASVAWGGLFAFALLGMEYIFLAGFPGFWVGLFAREPGILRVGSDYLIIAGAALPVFGLGMAIIFGLQGMGRTVIPLAAMVARFGSFLVALLVLDAVLRVTLSQILWVNAGSMIVESGFTLVVAVFVAREVGRDLAPAPRETLPATPDAHWRENVP